jgi:hypothetical protein
MEVFPATPDISRISGQLTPFIPALYPGQWLHVGKEVVFGMGRYTLEREEYPLLRRGEWANVIRVPG